MALILRDRVKETTTVTGTGTATLLGATTGFQSFAVVGNANTTYYCIADQGGVNWEVGIGTYTASGTTLARTTVLSSSNASSLVAFTAGVKDVFVTYPSEKGVWYDASGNILFTGTATAADLAYTGTLTGSTGILNIGSGQLYKDASGNVGIGTSSPTSSAGHGILTVNGSTGGQIAFNTAGTNKHSIYSTATDLNILNTAAGNITFSTSSAERMRINSSGNVGIGTTSPSTKLDVNGTVTATTFAGAGTNLTGTANSLNAGLGVNQTWQNVTGSRAAGTTYTNSTGKPIQVSVYKAFSSPFPNTDLTLTVGGIVISYQSCFSTVGGNWSLCVTGVVPDGATYSIAGSGVTATLYWNELR